MTTPAATDTSIFLALFDALARRMAGEEVAGAGALPAVSFPRVPGDPLGPAVPDDLRPRHWRQYLHSLPKDAGRLLDLGAGVGGRRGIVEAAGFRWEGLEIAGSLEPEDSRDVTIYDGRELPLGSMNYSAVLAVQAFERVADPVATFEEIARVLKPGGFLIGSTSSMEPYIRGSRFTCTAAAFAQFLDENGIAPVEIAPGIDAMTLMARRVVRQFGGAEASKSLNRFFGGPSPLHQLLDEAGAAQRVGARRVNALKLELTGQFHFLARKR